MPLTKDVIDALDPGIRDLVVQLNDAGFSTTDSGDGKSKPAEWYASGEAFPYPHVVCEVSQEQIVKETQRLSEVLGPTWRVEATYVPGEPALVCAMPMDAHLDAINGKPFTMPDEPQNWTTDAAHENGNYQCRCTHCGCTFYGHKRRAVCRVCASPQVMALEQNNDALVSALRERAKCPRCPSCASTAADFLAAYTRQPATDTQAVRS